MNRRRGVCYDIGRCFSGPTTRPVLDLNTVRRELQVIRDDLHANAVRICGAEISRVMSVAEEALQHGLEAWLCPELFEHDPEQTLQYIAEAAHAAEELRRDWPGQVVLSLGTELTLFMQGIFEGDHVTERIGRPSFLQRITDGTHNPPLNAFLAKANHAARQAFGGPVTYASALLESVDWALFDYVSVDAYRDGRSREAYAKLISPYFAHGRPVIVSEVGCCTYRGAANAGGMGWAIIDYTSTPLRLSHSYVRDEALQARELIDQLTVLDRRGINGAFVTTLTRPILTHDQRAEFDLDMASYSLVKSYDNRLGTTYPGMPWDPKESFGAVADYFAPDRAVARARALP